MTIESDVVARNDGLIDSQRDLNASKFVRRVAWGWAFLSGLVCVVCGVLLATDRDWQFLVLMGIALSCGSLCVLIARLVRHGRLRRAFVLLMGIAIGGGALPVLFVSGIGIFYGLALVVTLLAVVAVTIPQRLSSTGIFVSVLGIALIAVFDRLPPWSRLAASDNVLVGGVAWAAAAVGMGIAVWPFLRSRRVVTLRRRLLVAFVSLSLASVVLMASTGAIASWQIGRRQAVERLGVVSFYVQDDLDDWIATLGDELEAALIGRYAISYAQLLLRPRQVDPGTTDNMPSIRHDLKVLLSQYVEQTNLFSSLALLDLEGRTILATEDSLLGVRRSEKFISQCKKEGFCTEVSSGSQPDREMSLIAAIPVVDEVSKEMLGFLSGTVRMDFLALMLDPERAGGAGSELYLVGRDYVSLSALQYGPDDVIVRTEGIRQVIDSRGETSGLFTNYAGMRVVGVYRWLPTMDSVLVVEQRQARAFAATYAVLAANAAVAVIVALVAIFVALSITRTISDPLAQLANTAAQIAEGDLELRVESARKDEVGALARAFDAMTDRLRELVRGLERTVTERTLDLELRSSYLEAAADVGRAAAAILDPERLPQVAVELIQDRFDLGYVGLFQVEEGGEYAALRAETAKMGHDTKGRQHISVSDSGGARRRDRNGEVDARGKETALKKAFPELTLPLQSRGRQLGVVRIEGSKPGTFDRDMIVALETVADQVAVALDNALLFEESQAALDSARRISGELSREAWAASLRSRAGYAFRSDESGTIRLGKTWMPELEDALSRGEAVVFTRENNGDIREGLAVPVRIQGEVIGVLDTYKPVEAGGWTSEQIALIEQISRQLSDALENARLYEETQRRATREQQLHEIGTRMQSTVDLDAIMQMAIEDLARALDVPSAFVQLHEAKWADEE